MFLITTADKRFWKMDEPIIFLGEWCKLYNKREEWHNLEYEVLPYHWDDRAELYHDYRNLQGIYEYYLAVLSMNLNKIHNVSYSKHYWHIVIGTWLHFFIEILFDRYLSIKEAIDSGKVTNTWIASTAFGEWTPKDFVTFESWFMSDEYNHYLYGQIIKELGGISYEVIETKNMLNGKFKNYHRSSLIKSIIKKVVLPIFRHIPEKYNQIVFSESIFGFFQQAELLFSMGQMPSFILPNVPVNTHHVNMEMRGSIEFSQASNQFEELLNELIPEQIPTCYMEGYYEMHCQALTKLPKHPRLIVPSISFYTNEAFKFWTAYHVEHKAKMIIVQHGGHYGSGLWSSIEDYEMQAGDHYCTWGWREEDNGKTIPLSAPLLVRKENTLKYNHRGAILWTLMSVPRYSYFMFSVPVSSQMLIYLEEQYRFASAVSKKVFDQLLLRLYPEDYGWNEKERWAELFPELNVYQGKIKLDKQLNKSKLFIGTYNATTYLETFAANFPTIIFWNPNYWELRDSAQPYFDLLRKVGILHDTPESAAKLVNDIYEDPLSWWNQSEIQDAKNLFCSRFARKSGRWKEEWKKTLSGIYNKREDYNLAKKSNFN